MRADSLEDAMRNLARKVAAAAHAGVMNVEQRNLSFLDDRAFTSLTNAFQDELRHRGVTITPKAGTAKVSLTVSQNPQGYVGVVQIQRGDGVENLVAVLGRATVAEKEFGARGMMLHRELLFSQDSPILDVAFFGSDSEPVDVLTPWQITTYQREGDHWQEVSDRKIKLPRTEPLGRELVGHLRIGLDDMSVAFPEEICNISIHDGDNCHSNKRRIKPSDVPEQLLESKNAAPWTSAAKLEDAGDAAFIVASGDGTLKLFNKDFEYVAGLSGFGSEVITFRTVCGGGAWRILATGTGDWTIPDKVSVLELEDDKLVLAASTVSFDGPVVALRRGQVDQELQPANAVAVVRNLETGRYEAYRLTLTCGN